MAVKTNRPPSVRATKVKEKPASFVPTNMKAYQLYLETTGLAASTVKAYVKDAIAFERWEQRLLEEHQPKRQLQPMDLVQLYLISLEAKPAHRNRLLASLKRLCDYRQKTRPILPDTPGEHSLLEHLRKEPVPPKEEDPIPLTDLHKLLEVTEGQSRPLESQRNYALFLFLYGTGLPVTQVCSLKLEHLHHEAHVSEKAPTSVEVQKGRRKYLLPLSPPARQALKLWLNHRDATKKLPKSPYLFMTLSTNRSRRAGEPLDPQGIRALLHRYGKWAGFGRTLTPSRLRDTFAHELRQAGVEEPVLQALLLLRRRGNWAQASKLKEAVKLLPDPFQPL